MKPEYIVDLRGKKYPTYPGILDEAHEKGLTSIETELIQAPTQENDAVAIVKATVKLGDKVFVDYGDASPRNVNSLIATALIRMASTRAKGRALRDAVNVGQTMLEELPEEEVKYTPNTPTQPQKATSQPSKPQSGGKCQDCLKDVSEAEKGYSEMNYNKTLCRACQSKYKKV